MWTPIKTGIIALLVIFLAGPFIWNGITTVQNRILFQHVNEVAKKEADLVQLPNELKEEQDINKYSLGCHYDHKVRTTRCDTDYNKYYAVNNDSFSEFQKVDKYLTDLGWDKSYKHVQTMEEYDRLDKAGYKPTGIYSKVKDKFRLELHLTFYGEKDRRESTFEHEQKVNRLLDKYGKGDSSVYRISISTDIID